MRSSDFAGARRHKSSRSNDGDGNCVEVAELPGRVAMRDSKDPAGPVLAFAPGAWQTFLGGMRGGEFG